MKKVFLMLIAAFITLSTMSCEEEARKTADRQQDADSCVPVFTNVEK